MPWMQLKLAATPENASALSEAMDAIGALSVTMQDAADQPLYEPPPGALPLWNQTTVVGLFQADTDPDQVLIGLQQQLGKLPVYVFDQLEDRDWTRAWEDNFKAMQFGQRLWVVPSHTSCPVDNAIPIYLDPGLAFGTGTHPTTAMCLEWLDQHPPLDKQVIDYGCGSGILAVAACKLGATKVWGIDIDPQALSATQANAANNQVQPYIETDFPDRQTIPRVDLILANILANPLISLVQHFAAQLKPGGEIVLSGILAEQADAVLQAYRKRFDIQLYRQQNEWVALYGTCI